MWCSKNSSTLILRKAAMASTSSFSTFTAPSQRQQAPQRLQENFSGISELVKGQVVFLDVDQEETESEIQKFHRVDIEVAVKTQSQ